MKKILVADDEIKIRQLLSIILKAHGYRVELAENGWEAVKAVQDTHPDLVLCDITMDGLDGYGVLKKLKSDPALAAIPFIFLTGMGEKQEMRRGMERGADDYIVKPFTNDEILKAVEARLARQAAWRMLYQEKMDELRINIATTLPHELRTPLTGIFGIASLLKDEKMSFGKDQVREIAGLLYSAAERLSRLIENYILYGELEALSEDPRARQERKNSLILLQAREPFIVSHSISSAARKVALKAQREGDLELELKEATIPVVMDDLKKMVEELTDNAFKYSRGGTPVTVKGKVDNNGYVISITDRGRGMTSEQIAHTGAFMQFERKKFEQQGSGLGLSIAKRLAALYDGELKIESMPLKGTTVTIMLKT
ncbi:MAG: hybrid sensor histidine kinase/response regulator [Candidatus Eremiobacteraeota bacterium]|nr:hybrid sensor histidine kinase/response regulator [Candidatus Eremiobacteraeota bacterium]